MTLKCFGRLQRAPDRRIWRARKSEGHSISGRRPNQFSCGFRDAESVGVSKNFVQLADRFALLVNQQSGIADNVHEKDMGDLELEIGFELSGHSCKATSLRVKSVLLKAKLFPRQIRLLLGGFSEGGNQLPAL